MSDPVYDEYLTKGRLREQLLRDLRRAARLALLHKHGVKIRALTSNGKDTVEDRADEYADQMRKQPGVHGHLHGDAKVVVLAEIDIESFLVETGQKKNILGARGTKVITGESPVRSEKTERNINEEIRNGVSRTQKAQKGTDSGNRQAPLLLVESSDDKPLNLLKRLREVTAEDARLLLDHKGCDGITALRILTIAVFAKHSRLLALRSSPTRRSNAVEKGYREAQTNANIPTP